MGMVMVTNQQGTTTVDLASSNGNGNVQTQAMDKPINMIIPGSDQYFSDMKSVMSANRYLAPNSVIFTIKSINAGGGGAGLTKSIYLFNNDVQNFITDNGTGANSIQYTFQDGTVNGSRVSRNIANQRGGLGGVSFAFYIRMQTIGPPPVADPINLAGARVQWGFWDTFGNFVPDPLNIAENDTRADQDLSIAPIRMIQNVSRETQFKFDLPYLDQASVLIYFYPNPKI